MLEVSVNDCSQLHANLPENREFVFSKSFFVPLFLRKKSAISTLHHLYKQVHIGVDSSGTAIKLEQTAYNNMTFRIPDEKGFQPHQVSIEVGDSAPPFESALQSDIPLQAVIDSCSANPIICMSTDPGRFLCNYVYYRSLSFLQRRLSTPRRKTAVFIHIPPFHVIPKSVQLPAIKEIISAVILQATGVKIVT